MTQKELLTAIEALPEELQFALANSVLDRLASEGPPQSRSNSKQNLCDARKPFFSDPHKGEAWESVREELFGK